MNMETIIAGTSIGIAIMNGIASVALYLRYVKSARKIFCIMRAHENGEIEIQEPWNTQ